MTQHNKPYAVGITGGIGSGKSTVVSLFKEYGAGIIDSDAIAHELTEKDKAANHTIVAHFSPSILNDQQDIDRGLLRQIIFDNPEEKQWLETYLHPQIRLEIQKQLLKKTEPYVVIDIPLLNNRTDHPFLNKILVVDCPEAIRIERVCTRSGLSEVMVQKMIDGQISSQKRNLLADNLIMNNSDLASLKQTVHQLHSEYLGLASTKISPNEETPTSKRLFSE